ncbi:MAG: hypothetical protein GY804_02920 [Alphaproteobacteria bacterium]|nr:hypothetical protein [Alphaproteobacteria bacterium]
MELLNNKINIFKNAADNNPEHKITLFKFLEAVKNGKWREEIQYMRKLNTEHGKKACDEPKKLLPAVSFSGTFSGRRVSDELDIHSGLVQIDIDDCEDIAATRKHFETDPHIAFVFLSPRGTGIKAGLKIPRDKDVQKAIHEQARKHFGYINNEQWDSKVKDPARICFVSYDENLYINENAEEFKYIVPKSIPKKNVGKLPWIEDDMRRKWSNELFDTAFKMILDSGEGNLHDARLKAGTLLGGGVAHGLFFKDEALCEMERVVSTHTNIPRQAMKDVSDGIEYGMKNPLEPPHYIKKRTQNYETVIKAVKERTGEEITPDDIPNVVDTFFSILGHNNNNFYVMPMSTGTVLRIAEFSKANLIKMAPLEFWASKYEGEKGGVEWDKAISDCTEDASKRFFDYSLVRGRGVWLDGENTIVNYGNKVTFNGKKVKHNSIKSKWIYSKGIELEDTADTPLSLEDSKKIISVVANTPIQTEVEKKLFLGAIVVAPICGGVNWRSHIWVTGQKGTGKSWMNDNIITPLIGDFAIYAKGDGTTEAGIRQTLRGDALAVVHDEAESDSDIGARNMANKLLLARVASSEDRAQVLKGSASGDAMHYTIRSSFIFLSIGVPQLQRADESRISVINLSKTETAEDHKRYSSLQAQVATIDYDYCQKFRRRTIDMMPIIKESTKVFHQAIKEVIADSRVADQLSGLFAGAYSLESDSVISREDAMLYICSQDLSEYTNRADKEESDHYECLNDIMTSIIAIGGGDVRTIRELIFEGNEPVLARYGIKRIKEQICFAKQNSNLSALLANKSRFSKTYYLELKRISGVIDKVFKLNGKTTRGISVPLSEISEEMIVISEF